MNPYRKIQGALQFIFTLPIWYFIVYTLLKAAHVDRLVWFLFWIYMPVGIVASSFGVAADNFDRKRK